MAPPKGSKKSEETKAKMRAHVKTPEHRAKLSAAMQRYKKTPEHRAAISRTRKEVYGVNRTPAEQMAKIMARLRERQVEQAGRPRPDSCEVCGSVGKICFDHDHDTGLFRGWICKGCNSALGMVRDSTEVLEKLIAYLKGSKNG